jgi:hypothetical protein
MTDLLVLDAWAMRTAARVRRPGYADRYPHQFTIRSRITSGGETELTDRAAARRIEVR